MSRWKIFDIFLYFRWIRLHKMQNKITKTFNTEFYQYLHFYHPGYDLNIFSIEMQKLMPLN